LTRQVQEINFADDNADHDQSACSGGSSPHEELAEEAFETEFDLIEEESDAFISYQNLQAEFLTAADADHILICPLYSD
jgi:hypothetical protein